MDILYRELNRLDNDLDRLQMISILKSHLNAIEMNMEIIEKLLLTFHNENYRLKAIEYLIPFILTFLTSNNLIRLLDLFSNQQILVEFLKNCELLKTNRIVYEFLLHRSSTSFQIDNPLTQMHTIFDKNESDQYQNPSISTQTTQSNTLIDGSGDTNPEFI